MFEIATHEHAAAHTFVSQQHSIRITVFEIATHAHAAADTFVSQQRSVRIVFKSTTYLDTFVLRQHGSVRIKFETAATHGRTADTFQCISTTTTTTTTKLSVLFGM